MRERRATPVRIAIVGDFNRHKHSHWATEAALFHAAARLGLAVAPRWVPTASIEARGEAQRLAVFDGIFGAPGSPFVSMEGMLRAIEYARQRDVPYLGTCAGFQHALVEFTRNVLGIADADTAENDPNGKNIVITPIQCEVEGPPGVPRLSGIGIARAVPGTLLEEVCGPGDLRSEYFCSAEANPDFVARWEAAGLRVAARGGDGEMRALELPQNRFFVATLFQPQLSSSHDQPHPLIAAYLRACGDPGE
jgi:CTP synthase (UTP-ammonia lyase)